MSEWAAIFSEGLREPGRSNETQQAAEAIRALGTNAVPCLLAWSTRGLSHWSETLIQGYNHAVAKVNPDWIRADGSARRAVNADFALMALDYETIEADAGARAWWQDQGNEWLPIIELTNVLVDLVPLVTNGHASAHTLMRRSFNIGCLGTNATIAVPVMEALYNNPNPHVRRVATNAVRRIRGGKP